MISALIPPAADGAVYRRALLYYRNSQGQADSIDLSIESSGPAKQASTVRLLGRLPNLDNNGIDDTRLYVGIEQGTIIRIHPAVFAVEDTNALTLVPFVQTGEESLASIGVNARRNRIVDGEYLPSSEDVRVVVRSGFKVLWQSNNGMAFLTMIMPVRPETVREVARYSVAWDGTDNTGVPIPPGEYTADIVIPAKPAPYRTEITFTWPLKKK